ncbi:uncharacterized protein [Diabrotica undecimpunctata]|uniref:uncharacterized protein isoform X4 n=1 Tax=Diabrotica undecimpunctata TaxID=50387 RepID=UPI003B642B45
MEDNIEIKKGFTEYDQPCIESHLWTSVDLQDLKVEPEKGDLAKEVKVKKEEEFAEDDQKYIENHLWTSTDLQDLKAEPEENESGCLQNKKRMTIMKTPEHSSSNETDLVRYAGEKTLSKNMKVQTG